MSKKEALQGERIGSIIPRQHSDLDNLADVKGDFLISGFSLTIIGEFQASIIKGKDKNGETLNCLSFSQVVYEQLQRIVYPDDKAIKEKKMDSTHLHKGKIKIQEKEYDGYIFKTPYVCSVEKKGKYIYLV